MSIYRRISIDESDYGEYLYTMLDEKLGTKNLDVFQDGVEKVQSYVFGKTRFIDASSVSSCHKCKRNLD